MIDLDRVPFPVAYPFLYACDESLPISDRVENLIVTAGQAMRTTALLLAAEYVAGDGIDAGVSRALIDLQLPHWKQWTVAADSLAEYIGNRQNALLGDLADGWKDVSRGGGLAAATIEGLPTIDDQMPTANRVLWRARNDRSHRTQTRTHDRTADEQLLARLAPIVSWTIERLFTRSDLQLFRRIDDHVLRLSGAHPLLEFAAEPASQHLAVSPVVAAAHGKSIALHPFFAPLTTEPWRSGTEPVGLVDGWSSTSIIILGVRTAAHAPELVAPLQAAFEKKRARAATGAAKAARFATRWRDAAARTLTRLSPKKYVPATYVERPGVDDALRALRGGAKQALLALGDAGAGKSSLVARLVSELLSTTEDGVAFLTGRAAFDGGGADADACLAVAVAKLANLDEARRAALGDVVRCFEEQDPQGTALLWIVLDAMNEADRFAELVGAVDRFCLELGEHPRVRLVVTMRSGSYESLAARHADAGRHGAAVFANEDAFATFSAEGRLAQPFLRVRPFDDRELERAYDLQRLYRPQRACSAFADLPATTRRLLATPLWLHVFHETFSREKDVPVLDEGRLVDAYLAHLRRELPTSEGWLRKAAGVMLTSTSPRIDAAAALAWRDAFRSKLGYPAWLAKLDPVEELVAASLLTPIYGDDAAVTGYAFVHQRIAEAVLLDTLRKRILPRLAPSPEELRELAENAAASRQSFPELTGALGAWCRELVSTDPAIVATLVTLADAPTRNALLGTAFDELAAREPVPGAAWRPLLTALGKGDAAPHAVAALLHRVSATFLDGDTAREASLRDAIAMLLAPLTEDAWARDMLADNLQQRASVHERSFAKVAPPKAETVDVRKLVAALEMTRALIAESPQRDDLVIRACEITAKLRAADPTQSIEVDQSALLAIRDRLIVRPPSATPHTERARAQQLQRLGEATYSAGMIDLAHEAFSAAVRALRDLRAASKADAKTTEKLARAITHLGKVTGHRGDLVGGRRLVLEALELSRSLPKDDLSFAMGRDYSNLFRLARHPRIRGVYLAALRGMLPRFPANRVRKDVEPLPSGTPTCPSCAWRPTDAARWGCTCGHVWNTFLTGGVCPVCEHVYESTTCLSCRESNAHDSWYVLG